MGKSSHKVSADKTTTSGGGSGYQGPDAITQQRTGDIWNAAQAAGGEIPDSVRNAMAFLGGDQKAGQQYMNPYQQQVIDNLISNMGVANQNTMNQVNDAATRAGAFGGSRHGVATGVALAENQRNLGTQVSGLLNQGYADATNRAMNAANLGMTAGSPDLWRLNMLKQGFQGMPYGTTYANRNNQATTKTGYEGSVTIGG